MSDRLAESRYSSIRVMCPSRTCRYIAACSSTSGPVRQLTAQHVLLQHPVGRRHPPDDVIAQAGHRPVQALQHLQVVLDGLLDQVVVVPDDGVRSVDLAQRLDVAGFQRGEEADDKFLADGSALLRSQRATVLAIAAMICS